MTAALPSLANLEPNPAWASLPLFDRKGWKRVRFGDVVRKLGEQVDPVADGIERYVAGEHMETENVHIRKWGLVGDGYLGPAFIRGFRKGQVLYGSRRTYLKKVAVAEWDGVTANTTFVLEVIEGKLLQELLPWLMLSERFTKHSIQESKGSTNPYINFPDIAKFEFDLPPLDQQRRIAEILWAVDEVASTTAETFSLAESYRGVFLRRALDTLTEKQVRFRTVQELIDGGVIEPPQDGNHGELHPTSKDYVPAGIPFVMANDIQDGKLALDTCKRIPEAVAKKLRIGFARPGDILLSHKGSIGMTTIVPDRVADFIMLTPQVTYYRVKDSTRLRPKFLLAVLNSEQFQRVFQTRAKQSTRDYIGILAQRELPVSIPDVVLQDRILEELGKIEKTILALKMQLDSNAKLSAKTINAIC